MKDIQENKEKIFAQYWGQKVQKSFDIDMSFTVNGQAREGSYLELKPISQMTYSEASSMAIELGITIGVHHGENYPSVENYIQYLDAFSDVLSSHQVDLLRLGGFAVEYAGLSVEKQIEYKWIKLTK